MEKPLTIKTNNDLMQFLSRKKSKLLLVNYLDAQLEELFFIEKPKYKHTPYRKGQLDAYVRNNQKRSVFVYYPWRNSIVQMLNERAYNKLRTARNRNIITAEEQAEYRKGVVGIAGLSVGSSIFSTLVLTGGPKVLKIADPDVISVSNLNRIHAGIFDVGANKVEYAAKKAWETDPFLRIDNWKNGIDEESLVRFITEKPKLDIFVDEMDDIWLKLLARVVCKRYGIPVVMVTDNGDQVILDIERFDKNPRRRIFHGIFGNKPVEKLKEYAREHWWGAARNIIGEKLMTRRHKASIKDIGVTISGAPQIGTAAQLAGSVGAAVIRGILNNKPVKSGKFAIDTGSLFNGGK